MHLHFDDFKNSTEKEFAFLKEATSKNVGNFQTSLDLQQTYSTSLCSHVNNIYNKLAELQWQIQHHDPHMNSPTTIDQESHNSLIQGTASPTRKTTESEIEHTTPAPSHQYTDSQETDWPDAIPVEIPSQIDQPNDQRLDTQPT